MRVTVWCEGDLPTSKADLREVYPEGMEACIAAALRVLLPHADVGTATQADAGLGLPPDVLDATDVLIWWGHNAHDLVPDELVTRVQDRVLGGMGLLVLHSGHFSKIFRRLMGTTCALSWRNDGDRETLWTIEPTHPIARGVPSPIVLEHHETYGERFDIPRPDDVVFISAHDGGEVFRSGVTFTRGFGRVFYFSPGDESYPVFRHPDMQRVLANAVEWAAPSPAGLHGMPEAVHISRP